MCSEVSVIIPNYNHERFLRKRIDSVLSQTFQDFELIILDDCSTDNSKDIIQEYKQKDLRIKTVFNEKNSGNVFRQWKKGIDLARGKYVWIAESDDYADPEFLATLLDILKKNPSSKIAYCQSKYVDYDDNLIGNQLDILKKYNRSLWLNDFCKSGHEFLSNYMILLNIMPNASAVVFERALIDHINWHSVFKYRFCGDWFVWSTLLLHTELCYVSRPMNYFRVGDKTVRRSLQTKPEFVLEPLKIVNFIKSNVALKKDIISASMDIIFKRYRSVYIQNHIPLFTRIRMALAFFRFARLDFVNKYISEKVRQKQRAKDKCL